MTDSFSKRIKLGVVVAVLIMAVLSCRKTQPPANKSIEPTPQPSPAVEQTVAVVDSKLIERKTPFNHTRTEHKQSCNFCHQRPDNQETPRFPSHAACIICHQQDYTTVTSQMCVVCHKTPLEAEAALISFPARLNQFGVHRFSHKEHLDPGKTPPGVQPLKCNDCHRFDARGHEAGIPGHMECYKCHTHQTGEKFGDCGACHVDRGVAMKYASGPGAAFSLYNFRHGTHLKKNISCDRCHSLVEIGKDEGKSDVLQINTSRGQKHRSACWSCHQQAREPVCTKCHVGSLPF